MICEMTSEKKEYDGPGSGYNDNVTQRENESVGRLVETKPEEFSESLYIKRRGKFAFGKSCNLHERFIADLEERLGCTKGKLNEEFKITSQGQIEWLVDDKRRRQIWENITKMSDPTSGEIYEESHLIQFDKEHPVVIICGVAGTGKSTLLSHFYSEIKKKKPDCWVIRVNLVKHSDAILKLDRSTPDLIGFLIKYLHVVDSESPFSCSLLTNRLETGEQIVFMLDGYDEIGEKCQDIAIQMMKFIQKKGIQLYVTTRSHVAHHLQYELGQLAYYLENFNEEDQIDCLTKYWKKELKLPDRVQDGVQEMKMKKIDEFAKWLVNEVSKTLKDDKRALIGIPLLCRILAECYQQNVDEIVQSTGDVIRQSEQPGLFDKEKFDLVSLYNKLMETKRKIFLVEKTNTSKSDEMKDHAFEILRKKVESRLTKLALETIITEPNILEMLWPTKSSHKSSYDVAQEESILAKNTLKFGLTFSNSDGMRQKFMHRTFAEYFVAKYLYEGFHPDDERHNKLLEKEPIRNLILNKILASKQYDGVQVFFDGMVKTLVDDMDENKNWRDKIDNRQLPYRLKKFTENLLKTDKKFLVTNAFFSSVSNGKDNIFLLLCDCLVGHKNNKNNIVKILGFLICHDHYRSHLDRFLQFLSKSKAYSDDLNFINLLIEVFRSKEQMMNGGQIANTLKILHDLKLSTVLAQLYTVVLSKEPEAFQNIYQPCRIEEEDAIPTDLDILLKRDDYGMTLLHGAAFYGDVDIVDQILARFRQPKLDDGAKQQVNKVLLEANTPFYFAAAKNHEEVCSKLLAFVKDIFPNALMGELTELNGPIYRSLEHALESHNVEIFQLVLEVVKEKLGHACLVDLVTTTPTFSTEPIFCIGSRSENIFNAMVKIVVDRDGVVDYKILHDLIFYQDLRFNNLILTGDLLNMDAENLQGLLSVEGAGPFTKRLLMVDIPWNFHMLSSFLRHFNEAQLLDFVKIITLEDFWGRFLRSAEISFSLCLTSLEDVKTIFECLTQKIVLDKQRGDCAKQLLLHEDDQGYVVLHLPQKIVQTVLKCLPEKSQEEIKKEWKEKAEPMTHDSFINHDSRRKLPNPSIAKHYSNILRFYLDYGSKEVQLSGCVNILTSARLIDGQERCVWSYIFEHCEVAETNEILKIISVIFGWEAVKKLLTHEMDGFPLLMKAMSWGDDIGGRLDMLPEEMRNEMQQVIEQKAAEFIEEVLQHHKTYFGGPGDSIYKRLNTLRFLIKYCDAQQLEQFVENITTLQVSTTTEKTLSIWAEMLLHLCDEAGTNNVAKMNTFFKCVSEKLDRNAVKELVLHEIDGIPVIFYPMARGGEKMAEAMLADLDAIDRENILNGINNFLSFTYDC
ncbi:uncharacterized protein LOC130699685 [Daphnia carinata]|uniref:uncharacterized protein LOC130699685 n=1 Tax=Daphnia carinata TaxID=120202 RepID=UPI00257A252F|nr:uncharacterized protein LOC130699685 [Daphnia carinata]XP_059351959.1 uncharacterized protein LOC130699685 [Daphnia carinata]XP_059351960.1 uncharacterized protein LOC130699685 [Daphnia carinata]XP_059351961.1 uncharacterized protein LOC130699685 [Daphnia carinata]XP_059351962.1 uncharacterized protein LOC130699685 [Daphnia carinata]